MATMPTQAKNESNEKWSGQWLEGNKACGSVIEVKANVLTDEPKSNAADAFQCGPMLGK